MPNIKRFFLSALVILLAIQTETLAQKTQKVDISLRNGTLKQFINIIEKNTEYSFIFNSDINLEQKISVVAKQEPLSDVLKKVFDKKLIRYEILNKQILLSTPKKKKVSGQVIDPNGESITGANVVVVEETTGTITDLNGNFQLEVFDNATLRITYVGYHSKTVNIDGKSQLSVILEEDSGILDEVVVVGYGSIRKSDLTGSVVSLKMTDAESAPITSPDQLFQGRAAGVRAIQQSGAPGAGISIQIRGGTSISGSDQPLYVIDGYPIETETVSTSGGENVLDQQPAPNPLANISPNDIESMEILKDASATAIFGSRGANGVVLITTKSGKREKPRVNYNFRFDVVDIIKKIDVLNPREFGEFVNEARRLGNESPRYTEEQLDEFSLNNNNWQNMIYRTAHTHDHQLSVSGGDKSSNFAIVGNYIKQEGIVNNTSFERGSGRINYERDITSRLKIGGRLSFAKSTNKQQSHSQRAGSVGNNVVLSALITDPTGTEGDEESGELTLRDNPVILTTKVKDILDQFYVIGNVDVSAKITDELSSKFLFGINDSRGTRSSYQPRGTYTGNSYGGMAFRGEMERFNYLLEYTLSYNKTFSKKHRIDAVIGYTWQQWRVNELSIRTGGFLNDAIEYYSLGMGLSPQTPQSLTNKSALSSFLGRVNYSFDNRYLLTLTGRTDGSSRLAGGHRWDFFPSVALGWRINQEDFLKSEENISNLKLKASWGVSGNQSIGYGRTSSLYAVTRYPFNSNLVLGARPNTLGNQTLGWENTSQINLGIETGFFRNRYRLNFDYYTKVTTDLLLDIPISPSSGFSTYPINAGDVSNKGVEIEAGADIFTGMFKWSVSANYFQNKNKVTNLGELNAIFGPNYISSGGITLNQPIHIAKVGYPIGSFWGYKTDGIYQNYAEVAAGPEAKTAQPGDLKYVDVHKDNKIDANDLSVIGNPYPDFMMGVTNDFAYKQFKLNVLIQASVGGEVANLNRHVLDGNTLTESRNISRKAWEGRWQGEGTSNYYPRLKPSTDQVLFNQLFSDFLLEDASYLRLKSISLSYNIPLKKIKWIQRMQVYVTGTNLITLSKYKGYDPEVSSSGGSALTPSVDLGTFPISRTVSFGLSVGF